MLFSASGRNDSLIETVLKDIYWCAKGVCENPPYRHKERTETAKMKKVLSLVCSN